MQKARGCNGYDKPIELKGANVPKAIKGSFLNRCIMKEATNQSRLYLESYNLFTLGFMPYGNEWIRQPMKLLEAFKIISAATAEIEGMQNVKQY